MIATQTPTAIRYDAVEVGMQVRLVKRVTASAWTVTSIDQDGPRVLIHLVSAEGHVTTDTRAYARASLYLV